MAPPPIRSGRITLTLPRLSWMLLSLILLTGGAYLWRLGYIDYTQCRAFAKGPTASAAVTDCHIDTAYGKKGPRYSVVVTYEYSVNGTAFTGTRLFLDPMSTDSLTEAEAVMSRFPTGAHVPTYYDPTDPRSSVLDTRLTREVVLPPFLGGGVIVVAGLFLWGLKNWFYRAGLPINVRRSGATYVIEPSEPQWRYVGLGVGIVLLLCGIPIGRLLLPTHIADPWPTLSLAACVLGPVILIGFELQSRASLRAGRECIVIDPPANRVQLRSASKRKPPKLDVAASDILAVGSNFRQQVKSSPNPNGRYAHYAPSIEYFQKGGIRATMSLDDFQFLRKDTDELCRWLRFILALESSPSRAEETLA